ncbi:MCE family protein [Gordonia sp. TBRC 11910]|uniref:MCE family protein n=1 Tax=Gordonia asplenii TaxID=2725283 RepID=A0A848L2M6_9ACTN|nr:MCE family protein [Gordonia asplenii]NMO05270.1 MCE family protein [Gordonia asplenii]
MNITRAAIKLAVFLTATATITAFLFIVVGNLRWGPTTHYSAEFASASGTRTGDDVKVAGVVVGKVTDVRVEANAGGAHKLGAVIDFDVNNDTQVTQATTATIKYKNLIGDRYLQLDTDSSVDAPARTPGTMLPLSQTKPALDMDALVNGFKPLLQGVDPDQANKLTASLISVLNGRTQDLGVLVSQVGELGQAIADRDAAVGSTVTDLNVVLDTVATRSVAFGQLITQLQSLFTGLADDRVLVRDGLTHIEAASAQLSDLLQRTRPDLTADIAHLRGLAANLNNDTSTLNLVLSKLPAAYQLMGRASGYGSFVNFFVCGLAIRYPTIDGGHADTPMFTVPARRCH